VYSAFLSWNWALCIRLEIKLHFFLKALSVFAKTVFIAENMENRFNAQSSIHTNVFLAQSESSMRPLSLSESLNCGQRGILYVRFFINPSNLSFPFVNTHEKGEAN
jgi:hypothetical protein